MLARDAPEKHAGPYGKLESRVHLTIQARFGAGASEKGWYQYLVGVLCYQNLRERLKEVMDRKQDCLPEVEGHASDAIPAKARGRKGQGSQQVAEPLVESSPEKHYKNRSAFPNKQSEGMRYDEFQKQVRRDKRTARYEEVCTLMEQGFSQRAIARKLHLARATVSKFAQAEEYPEMHHPKRGEKRSILDPYKPYLLERWQHGCTNGVQLYDEIKARGYPGSAPLLGMFLAELRRKHQEAGSASVLTLNTATQVLEMLASLPSKSGITRRMSGTRASWLCVSQPDKLDEKQLKLVEQIKAAHLDLETAYQLGQAFVMMLAECRDFLVVLWRLRYKLSLRDVAEMFLERGWTFTHETVRDWEARFAPLLADQLRGKRHGQAGRSWYIDETYIKVHGKWCYLYRAIDHDGGIPPDLERRRREIW
jgi:hypothetical protein